MNLKVKDVIKELSAAGISMRKTDHGEFRVNYKGAGEGPAYYTDDLKDARDTGLEMARRGYQKNPSKRRGSAKWRPAEKRFAFSPHHYDFEWSKDGKFFRATKRAWTDFSGDQSYAKYQARSNPMSAARYHRLMGPKGMAKFKRQTYRKGRPSLYKLYLQSVTARSAKGRRALSELARKRAGYSKKNPRKRRYRSRR